jgi:hypothetical protein
MMRIASTVERWCSMQIAKPSHITEDDPLTLEEMYERARVSYLPEPLQQIAIAHQLDQWEAEPSIIERNAQQLQHTSLRQ